MINSKLNEARNSKLIKYTEHEEFGEICGNHHSLIHTINNKNPSILELFNYNNLYKNKDLNHKLEDIDFSVNDFKTLGILYKCSELESNIWNKWIEIHINNYHGPMFIERHDQAVIWYKDHDLVVCPENENPTIYRDYVKYAIKTSSGGYRGH